MAYDDIEKNVTGQYLFMADKSAKNIFAKLDYILKSGTHIQYDYPQPVDLYNFLDKYYLSLKDYYSDFFEMLLKKEGDGWNTYFYIDFQEGTRGKIPNENQYRNYLKPEYILIGLLFFKIYKLDGNIELGKISDFINLLYQEYDELLSKMQRLVSSLSSDADSDLNEEKLNSLVTRAFAEFEQLGWISTDKNDNDIFVYQPSFERLRRIYYPQIENIDEIIKRNGHA
jgi:chromosome condensin MukBEF MukE localization factor